jgi:microcystin-dependent protein
MTDQYVAEIRIFPFNFAPTGWATCDGQLLPISQNTALFSLLGTNYGGNGATTFGLPNLQGSAPIHVGGGGGGPGLTPRFLGEQGGSDTVSLLQSETPVHTHSIQGGDPADFADIATPDPPGGVDPVLGKSQNALAYQTNTTTGLVALAPQALSPAGGDQPHTNLQPYLTLNFCIALQGVFPPRS